MPSKTSIFSLVQARVAFEFSGPSIPLIQRLPGPFSCYLRMPNPLNQRLLPYFNSQLFSWWRSLGRVLARCTKSLASQAKLAMGSVRECPPPLECRGLIKIRSRRGVLQVLPQPLPIQPRTSHSTCLFRRILLGLKLMTSSTVALALSSAGLCPLAHQTALQFTSCRCTPTTWIT